MKADSDAPAAENAESEQTGMLFLDFLYNSIVNILPICIMSVGKNGTGKKGTGKNGTGKKAQRKNGTGKNGTKCMIGKNGTILFQLFNNTSNFFLLKTEINTFFKAIV